MLRTRPTISRRANGNSRQSLAGAGSKWRGNADAHHTSTAPATDGAAERVLTLEEVSRRLNVSTKTISRWRQKGLKSCRFVLDGRERIGFRQSAVDQFVQQNPECVRRGAKFSQLTDGQRKRLIDRARRLAQGGEFPAEVTKRLARETGRSAETVRYTLRRFDLDHPEAAVFPDHNGPLREETKQSIFQRYRRGETVAALATRFRHHKASIRRIIAEMRVKRIMQLPLVCMPNEEFPRVRSEKAILGPPPASDRRPAKVRLPKDLPPYLASLYEVPLLTREQEMHLFRKMNYLKYKAGKLVEELDPKRPKARLMDRIEKLHDQAVATKNEIIRANLRLVVSIAKQHLGQVENFFELVSDGNMALIRAVEKFDFALGNRFSTYASWAIIKSFARTIPNEIRHHTRFRTSRDEVLSATESSQIGQHEQESAQLRRENQVERLLQHLDQRERKIISHRFGLTQGQQPLTLKQVGVELGVSKERTRQLEVRAINKLRAAALEENIEIPGIG